MDANEKATLARKWLHRGALVLPLDKAKRPVGHLVPDGFLDAGGEDCLWWFSHEDTHLVGLVPGTMGLVVLDVDVKGAVDGRQSLADLEAQHSPIDRAYTVPTMSGGEHIYLRKVDKDVTVGNRDLCTAVNVRCDRGYVVAPGNPGYRPDHQLDFSHIPEAPEWLWEHLTRPEAALADYGEDVTAHMEQDWTDKVQAAHDSFDPAGDRHTSMISAVNALASYELLDHAGSTAAIEALEDRFIAAVADRSSWSEACSEYRRAVDGARRRVRTHESHVLEDRRKDQAFAELIRANGGSEEDVEHIIELAESNLRMYSMRELRDFEFDTTWLVRNVLITPTYGQIAGESKTLKTYLSQYLGLAVATGQPFLGRFPVDTQGPVVYFVGEGGMKGWVQRMPRIARSVGIEDVWDAPIHASFTPAPFLSDKFRRTVADVLDKINPVLTIIDPLYAFHGGDIEASNLHQEGALLTAVAEPFVEHGSTILILNHFNKATSGRSLKRITMAGSGEWVDSWMMTTERAEPDLNRGEFSIGVEFGSRQWGGSKWELDVNIGTINPMTGEPDGDIVFNLSQSWE